MSNNKVLIISAVMAASALVASAQSSSNSPYTRFGLGELSNRGFANNAAMGGIGYGLRSNSQINLINPASISAVDSLSFMFDVGMSLRSSNYEEDGIKNNAKNSSFDYIAMQFRLHPRLGMAISFTPFSTVGYNFSQTEANASSSYYGDGGLQQISAGLGFKFLKNLSVGVNAGYLYGSIDYQTTTLPSGTGSDYTINYQKINVKNYTADFGIQYTQALTKNDKITAGFVYGLGHNLHATYTTGTQVTDNSSYSATTESVTKNGFSIPHTYGVGFSYNRKRNLTVGLDYTLQKWSSAQYNGQKGGTDYFNYKDLSKVAAGAEFLPNPFGRSYIKRIRYRAGAYYNNSYLGLSNGNEFKEYGVSLGLGLPLYLYQRSTILNITGQYVRVKPSVSGMISENRFVIKLGLTFNEHWFMKWKVN